MATTTAKPWQQTILDELGELQLNDEVPADHTHAAVLVPADAGETAMLLGTAENELAAIVIAEDKGAPFAGDGEARVVKLADLIGWSKARADGAAEPDLDGPTIEPRRQNVETEEGAQVDLPPDDDEHSVAAPPPEPGPGEQAKAFDDSDYEREDLQIPKVDGETIDKIRIKFEGDVMLERSDIADVALYNRLKLGQDVEIRCAGKVSSTGTGFTTNREGNLDVVVGSKTLKVESVWVLDPEELRS